MTDRKLRRLSIAVAAVILLSLVADESFAQTQRIRPLEVPSRTDEPAKIPKQDLPADSQDDRVLVEKLEAVMIVDAAEKVSLDPSIDSLEGLHLKIAAGDSILHRSGTNQIVNRYLGKPISLRNINQLNRDLIKYYQSCGQPIVDVVIPEQRITGGTLQIIVIETRIGRVMIDPGCVFDSNELDRWIECTRPGDRVYESRIQSDLFWLNQSPFRRVTVDFEQGAAPGTTDVFFRSNDVTPLRGYIGADDTGVETLNYGRVFAGMSYGNLFGRSGTLGYQYTTDQDFARLEAHSVSYTQPLDREYSLTSYGSWAGVKPALGGGLTQDGESWQTGLGLVHHLIRDTNRSRNLTAGFDFRSTNNNLEFSGTTVAASNADLIQIRLGADDAVRYDRDQYRVLRFDTYVGPGGGLTSAHSVDAFQSIRPGSSPDYIYARAMAERTCLIDCEWMLLGRLTGQAASERLLFSETLGLGGYDTVRGFDERASNADHGLISNLEFGPKTIRWGSDEDPHTFRPYTFLDMGNGYLQNPLAGEDAYTFVASTGLGFRYQVSDRLSTRFDWGYGFEDFGDGSRSNRFHLGLTWIPGPRP